MADTDTLKIERIGGLAGFGLPGSALKSQGEVAWSALSVADRRTLDGLFAEKGKWSAATAVDGFRYRLTRTTASGKVVIEVPESLVSPSVRSQVKDTLD